MIGQALAYFFPEKDLAEMNDLNLPDRNCFILSRT